MNGIDDDYSNDAIMEPIYDRPEGARSINQLGRGMSHESFKGDDPLFEFMGNIERKPKGSIAMTLDAPPGSGKTRFMFQVANAMAGAGYRTLFASLEEHPDSRLFIDKRDQYIDPANYHNIDVVSYEDIETMDGLDAMARSYDIVIVDSAGKVRHFDLDRLRKNHTGKLFVVIYQRTQDERMRGGSDAQFDGDLIAKIELGDNYTKNYVFWAKNRYSESTDAKYLIAHQKTLTT